MRSFFMLIIAAVAVLAVGCQAAVPSDGTVATKDKEIAALKAQVKQREDEITALKKSLATPPAPPNQTTVAVGQGDGRFVVIPSKVRAGFPIGIFTDSGDGQLRLIQAADGKEIARMAGPKASEILVYTIPKDLAPGSYRLVFSGHGGTTGEAVIQVEGN